MTSWVCMILRAGYPRECIILGDTPLSTSPCGAPATSMLVSGLPGPTAGCFLGLQGAVKHGIAFFPLTAVTQVGVSPVQNRFDHEQAFSLFLPPKPHLHPKSS